VPRFYFDVWDGGGFTRDDEGLELASLEAAEHEARRTAAGIGHDRLPKGDTHEITVKVRDDSGLPVFSVTVTMTTWRAAFAPG
jgi:hypothetical protein